MLTLAFPLAGNAIHSPLQQWPCKPSKLVDMCREAALEFLLSGAFTSKVVANVRMLLLANSSVSSSAYRLTPCGVLAD